MVEVLNQNGTLHCWRVVYVCQDRRKLAGAVKQCGCGDVVLTRGLPRALSPEQSPHLSFLDCKGRRQRGACWKWALLWKSVQLVKSAVKVVQLVGKGGITVADSCSALLVLNDLLQASPESSGVVGSELVLKFTLVLRRLGLLDRLLHLALSSPEFLPAAVEECRVLLH